MVFLGSEEGDCIFLISNAWGFCESVRVRKVDLGFFLGSLAIVPETCAEERLTHPKHVVVTQNNTQKMAMIFLVWYNFFSRKLC